MLQYLFFAYFIILGKSEKLKSNIAYCKIIWYNDNGFRGSFNKVFNLVKDYMWIIMGIMLKNYKILNLYEK